MPTEAVQACTSPQHARAEQPPRTCLLLRPRLEAVCVPLETPGTGEQRCGPKCLWRKPPGAPTWAELQIQRQHGVWL